MQITAACASCGSKYRLDEKYAGRTFSCKQCSAAIQVSKQMAPAPTVPMLRFECENCSKAYTIAPEHAGKKTVCSNCGFKFRVPGGGSSVAASTSAQRSSKAASASATPAPAELDIYGLKDEPPFARAPGGRPSPSQASLEDDSRSADPDSLLPRRDHYKPLSEGKKKKITKRADKLDRMKPTSAGVGISFGAVFAIALIGWRLYRIMHRYERAAARASADQSAPEHVVIDFKTFVAENDKETEQAIASPNTAEAPDWLDPVKHPKHAVAEMSVENARTMVAGFYERGAQGVYVLDPSKVGDVLVTSQFAVKLSDEPAQRRKCLEWAAKYEGGGEPSTDHGQKYLIISTGD